MDMLLRDVSIDALAQMFQRYRDGSPAPHLTTPRLVRQAKRLARRNSIWGDLDKNLDPSREIPVITRSAYRQYQRTGNRSVPQAASHRRAAELSRAAMALWLDHPNASVDYLQDLLWAYCDDWTWVMAAHEGSAIDIGSASLAVTLAEILHVLDAHL